MLAQFVALWIELYWIVPATVSCPPWVSLRIKVPLFQISNSCPVRKSRRRVDAKHAAGSAEAGRGRASRSLINE